MDRLNAYKIKIEPSNCNDLNQSTSANRQDGFTTW